MAITDALVLPADVVLVPVETLTPDVRGRIAAEAGDVAVTRPLSRSPSRLVDRDFAELLRQFATPKTVAEAVIAYAQSAEADPETILVDAYPVLQGLVASGFLVEVNSPAASAIAITLKAGERVAGATVNGPLQITDDGELYAVAFDDGVRGALKIARRDAGEATQRQLANEAEILRRLDGSVTPRVLDAGSHDGRAFVIVEWIDGIDAASAAASLRASGTEALRELCVRILEAYARLHARGVVHSDVHPRNVLIGPDGRVTVIDFGIAHAASDGDRPHQARAGVPFFLEPEAFDRHGVRESTTVGEQYALGALTYLLMTGEHYLDFSIERTALLQQIALEGPVPFASRKLLPQPALERVLARALAKNPAERYASVAEFAAAVSSAPLSARADDTQTFAPGAHDHDNFIDAFVVRLRRDSPLFATGFLEAPTASVTYGAAGTAYALWRIACARGDADLLALAGAWCERASRELASDRSYCSDELEMTREIIGEATPYHTESGVHAVAALIALGAGNILAAQQSIDAFIRAAARRCARTELVLGRAGALQATALLLEALPDTEYLRPDALILFGDALFDELCRAVRTHGPIAETVEIEYTGIAHGWAGMLYALLSWLRVRRRGTLPEIADRLAQLAAFARPAGNGVRVPWHVAPRADGPFFMPGWCNGSAGFVHLWNLAHVMFHDPAYATLAERTATNVAESLHGQESLCCGLAGQAYALLNMYNHSGERRWLDRAERLAVAARHAATRQTHTLVNRSESLYKGDLGVAVLLAEIRDPRFARMPFFELDAAG